jgi:hypothetical protein
MRKALLSITFIVAVSAIVSAQETRNRVSSNANSETSVQKQGRQIDLQSATQLAAQLEGSLDARHAKVGDRVVLKTVQAVKQNGETVIPKGARLIGRVTDVEQQTKSTAESHIGLVFDRLRSGSTEIPITATILSITQARGRAQAGNGGMETDTMSQSSTSTRSSAGSSGGGGLLGGVGNTVGGVLNTTTTTAGNVVGTTVGTTSRTAGNLTGSLSGLQISESGSASAEGGSTLSLSGRNLRLESGTTFNLAVSNSTSAGTAP